MIVIHREVQLIILKKKDIWQIFFDSSADFREYCQRWIIKYSKFQFEKDRTYHWQISYALDCKTRRLKISNQSKKLKNYSDVVFSSGNLETTRREKVSPGRDLVAFSGYGVTCMATETVKGNRVPIPRGSALLAKLS